jgi:hypothetical protein
VSHYGIEIVSAASLVGSGSGFSGLEFHNVTVSTIKHHADVAGLTVEKKKTRIVLKSGFIWKESGGELAAHNITQPKAVLPEELVNQSKGLVFRVGNERGERNKRAFIVVSFLIKLSGKRLCESERERVWQLLVKRSCGRVSRN